MSKPKKIRIGKAEKAALDKLCGTSLYVEFGERGAQRTMFVDGSDGPPPQRVKRMLEKGLLRVTERDMAGFPYAYEATNGNP